MKETDLFPPLHAWLEAQDYAVHSEVRGCDIVARRGEEVIIIEMKLRASMQLLLQAVQRQEYCDSVYMATALGSRGYPKNFTAMKRLLRRLGIGLIFVRFMKTKTRVEVALHPDNPRIVQRPAQNRAIIREINGRYAEFNRSGEPVTQEKITAYKQQSLYILHQISVLKQSSPAKLRSLGLPARSGTILSRNVYGWFVRESRGVYALSNAGTQALENYRSEIEQILDSRGDSGLILY